MKTLNQSGPFSIILALDFSRRNSSLRNVAWALLFSFSMLAGLCRQGFAQSAGAIGSAYHYTNGLPVLGFTGGSLSLLNGNLAQGINCQIGLTSEKAATDGSAPRLTINTSSGLFQTSVINPETGRPISVRGAVLQNQNYGAGLFLGASESGSAFFSPAQ